MQKHLENLSSKTAKPRVSVCSIILASLLVFINSGIRQDVLIFDFSRAESLKEWQVISQPENLQSLKGKLSFHSPPGLAIFSGTVPQKDIGGFCMVISPSANHQLQSFAGLLIRLKGDGKYYIICIYNHSTNPGVSYQAGFNTRKDRLDTVFLPFSSFVPYYRGRLIREWPVLDQSRIIRIGIMVDDRQPGPFRLEIQWIKAVSY
jgi:NADH dehydrogenase [ubiquinone] 1 alpha subcomplex assembly factor 1